MSTTMNTSLQMVNRIIPAKRGIYKDLIEHKASIAIIGLSNAGINLATKFSKDFKVIAFDHNTERVGLVNNGIHPFGLHQFEPGFAATSNKEEIAEARFYIIASKVAVNEYYKPKLKNLIHAIHTVSSVLKKRDFVVFESTSYPGCVEELCLPILEKQSGLSFNKDFKIGFSPERFDYRTDCTDCDPFKKLVSAGDKSSLGQISEVYGHIYDSEIHKIPNIRLTEILKIISHSRSLINERRINFVA